MKRDDTYYAAMLARDPRFDGKFFIGVKTTGIYCRPICPAKPKRENCEFFPSHLAAERSGYRPCLRCRPESAPRSAVWIGTSAVVKRALRVIHHRETMELDEDHFAAQFGVSARHLRRLFQAEIGKTPTQISFENRLNLARQLLHDTSLPITEVALASGFQSIRRFNTAFRNRFERAPREIRRTRGLAEHGLKTFLPYRPPFDFAGLLHSYRNHAVGDLERFESDKMHRLASFGEKTGWITISNDAKNSRLSVEIQVPDTSGIQTILSRVRTMFDLDSDPILVANALERNPKLRTILRRFPGIRLPSGWEPFEIATSTILGQLVSLSHTRALVRSLIELAGAETTLADGKTVKLFPTPLAILEADLTALKSTRARKSTLVEFAKAVYENRVSLEPTQDVDRFMESILTIRGIGPWTANYMALKVLRHTDSFPASDLVLARALQDFPPTTIDSMRPWRGYVAALLWRQQMGKKESSWN